MKYIKENILKILLINSSFRIEIELLNVPSKPFFNWINSNIHMYYSRVTLIECIFFNRSVHFFFGLSHIINYSYTLKLLKASKILWYLDLYNIKLMT